MPIGEPQWWVDQQQQNMLRRFIPFTRFAVGEGESLMEGTPIYNRLRRERGDTRTFDRFDSTEPATRHC